MEKKKENFKYPLNNENGECKLSQGNDELDKAPNNYHVTFLDFVALILAIIFHLGDLYMDGEAAYSYYAKKEYWYCTWTLGLNLISGIIITSISVRMYVADRENKSSKNKYRFRIGLCIFGVVFQTATLIRVCDALKYSIKSYRAELKGDKLEQKRFFVKKLHEEADSAWLKVFECYLESAPTTILQIAFMLLDYNYDSSEHLVRRCILLALNFIAMGWSMASYNRCIRFDQENKQNISLFGIALQLLWHAIFTVSRILALTALASISVFWTCVSVTVHWCVMTVWIAATVKTNFCGSSFIMEILFSGVVGLVYIFNFFSLKDKPTRNYYCIFYGICFIENVAITTIWGIYSRYMFSSLIYYLVLILPTFTFVIGVSCAYVYYKFWHPNIIKRSKSNEPIYYTYPLTAPEQKL